MSVIADTKFRPQLGVFSFGPHLPKNDIFGQKQKK